MTYHLINELESNLCTSTASETFSKIGGKYLGELNYTVCLSLLDIDISVMNKASFNFNALYSVESDETFSLYSFLLCRRFDGFANVSCLELMKFIDYLSDCITE